MIFKFLLNFYYFFFKKHAELALPPKPEPSQFLINLAKIKNRAGNPNLSEMDRHNLDVLMNEVIPEEFEKAFVSKNTYFSIDQEDLIYHKSAKFNSSDHQLNQSWERIKMEACRRLSKEHIPWSSAVNGISFETSYLVEKIKDITIPSEKSEEEKEMNSIGLYR